MLFRVGSSPLSNGLGLQANEDIVLNTPKLHQQSTFSKHQTEKHKSPDASTEQAMTLYLLGTVLETWETGETLHRHVLPAAGAGPRQASGLFGVQDLGLTRAMQLQGCYRGSRGVLCHKHNPKPRTPNPKPQTRHPKP